MRVFRFGSDEGSPHFDKQAAGGFGSIKLCLRMRTRRHMARPSPRWEGPLIADKPLAGQRICRINASKIINAVIAPISAIVTYKLVPWIKTKTTVEQQKLPEATVKTLVFAAEQLYGAGEGSAKLGYVVAELEKRGFTADRVAIEATVKENLAALHATKEAAAVHVEIE